MCIAYNAATVPSPNNSPQQSAWPGDRSGVALKAAVIRVSCSAHRQWQEIDSQKSSISISICELWPEVSAKPPQFPSEAWLSFRNDDKRLLNRAHVHTLTFSLTLIRFGVNKSPARFLADRTARSVIGHWQFGTIMSSVCLLGTLCIMVKRYILREKMSQRVNRKCPLGNTILQL